MERKVFSILEAYLQPTSDISAATAAAQIDELFPTDSLTGPAAETALTHFWSLFIVFVEQIPDWENPAQKKLIALIQALCQLPNQRPLDLSGCDWNYGQLTLWKDLPTLDGVLVDNVESHAIIIADDSEDEKRSRVRNLNFQSFAAQLTAEGLFDVSRAAVYSFSGALEEDPDSESIESANKVGTHLDAYILPINVWISLAAKRIWELCKVNGEGALRNDMPGGAHWTGKEGFSVERWQFWKQRLDEVAVTTEASDQTRAIAKAMKEKMVAVEA
ncbi:hypothetical protein BDN70DRAFT_821464 [Pholiota conissans]|uniref:Uncharacterized protein n=1 Tax=Pholiota conissans TaxID=109636 RepID=A0A9P5YK25_9AGAR|nr:hypothetical protein BDN70DRAFT_821464 [Pholiota conissans]